MTDFEPEVALKSKQSNYQGLTVSRGPYCYFCDSDIMSMGIFFQKLRPCQFLEAMGYQAPVIVITIPDWRLKTHFYSKKRHAAFPVYQL